MSRPGVLVRASAVGAALALANATVAETSAQPMSRIRVRVVAVSLAAAALAVGPLVTGLEAAPQDDALEVNLVDLDTRLEGLAREVAPSVVQIISSGYAAGGGALIR